MNLKKFTYLSFILFFLLYGQLLQAQTADLYIFSASSGTFTEITDGTEVNSIEEDDANSAQIPLGFTFNFAGTAYTNVVAGSNGYLTFSNPATTSTSTMRVNSFTVTESGVFPILAVAWDDLIGSPDAFTSDIPSASYTTTGTAGNHIFTFQWLNYAPYTFEDASATISFQIKLYEADGKIEYIYRQEPEAENFAGASIGIADASGSYLCLNNASATPTASSTINTTNITTRPATGQVFTFMPPTPCNGMPDPGNALSTVTAACAATPFTLSFSNPIQNSGYTYQWYSSPAGAGTFTPIATATNSTYTVPNQTTATDYFCEVICTTSSLTAYTDTISISQNPANQCYCIPTTQNGNTYYISNFTTTGGIININKSSAGTATGYEDFHTTDSISIMQNVPFSYSITVAGGSTYGRAIWIDFNEDGVFQSTEQIVSSTSYLGSPLTGNYTIPLSAPPGSKRMRIISTFTPNNPSNPCINTGAGEYEDYTINIIPLPDCSGMPNAGDITGAPASVCPNSPFTMSLPDATIASGITYQWYSSPSGAGTFTPIATANNNTYTVTNQTAATDYFCEISCSNSNQTTYSDTVQVAQTPANQCYCIPTTSNGNTYYISNFTTTGGAININKSSTGSATGYQDFHATDSVVAMLGTSFDYTITVAGGSTYGKAIWIDYNEDGEFQSTEQVASSNSYVGSPLTGSITIPITASQGSKRMRVVSTFTPNNPSNPCSNTGAGEYEDYTIRIIPMPDCSSVTFPTSVNAAAVPGTLCISGDIHLNIDAQMPLANNITYQWQNSATETGTYNNIGTANTTPQYTYNASSSGWYRCQIRCNGSTVLTSSTIYVEAVVPEEPILTEGQHCGPGEVTLSGTVSSGDIYWYDVPAGGSVIASGNNFTTPYLSTTTIYYASAGASQPVDSFVGSGTTASTGAETPFFDGWGGYKHQYIIRADELQAIGLQAGAISEIGVYVTTNTPDPNPTFNNFSIAMGSTDLTALGTAYEVNVSEVFAPVNYTPVYDAVNTFTLNTPFIWDGLSNIIIQTCHSNEDNGGGDNVKVRYNTTSYVSTRYSYMDGTPVDEVCESTTGTTLSRRPIFYFLQPGCQSNRVAVNANIRDTPIVNLGPDESICGDANQSITLDAGNPGSTYVWNDGSTGQTLTVSQPGDYYVTVTNEYGCVSSDTTHKEILTAPLVNLGPNDTTICEGVVLTLDAGDDGTTYFWNTGANTQTIEVNTSGQYFVAVSNDIGCTIYDTITVNIGGVMPTIGSIVIDNSGPYTFTFSVFNLQGAVNDYLWDFGDGTPVSHEVNPTHTYADNGSYQVTLTLTTAECGLLYYNTSIHILGVDDIAVDENMLTIYPNPASDNITIDTKGNFSIQEITVINTLGQVLMHDKIKNSKLQILSVSDLASGIYSIRIKTDKGYVTRKFEVLR